MPKYENISYLKLASVFFLLFFFFLLLSTANNFVCKGKRKNLPEPNPSRPCVQPDCTDSCVRLYGQSASSICIPHACQCF
ncbi:hypothetical protein AMTRI_Chr01g102930 [Amborella trichopoda]